MVRSVKVAGGLGSFDPTLEGFAGAVPVADTVLDLDTLNSEMRLDIPSRWLSEESITVALGRGLEG